MNFPTMRGFRSGLSERSGKFEHLHKFGLVSGRRIAIADQTRINQLYFDVNQHFINIFDQNAVTI
jgi:hypothetical protein